MKNLFLRIFKETVVLTFKKSADQRFQTFIICLNSAEFWEIKCGQLYTIIQRGIRSTWYRVSQMFCPKKGGYASSKFCYYGQDMAHYSHGLSINVCSRTMVLISIGISVIGAQVRSNPFYLICLRHLIRSRAVTNRISSPKKTYFLTYVRYMFWVPI